MALDLLLAVRDVPHFAHSDNGPEFITGSRRSSRVNRAVSRLTGRCSVRSLRPRWAWERIGIGTMKHSYSSLKYLQISASICRPPHSRTLGSKNNIRSKQKTSRFTKPKNSQELISPKHIKYTK